MAFLVRRELLAALTALMFVVSGGLFFMRRAYRNQNVPLWRAKPPIQKTVGRTITQLVWSPDSSRLWAHNNGELIFCLDSTGKLRFQSQAHASLEEGKEGRLFFSDGGKAYEWNNGNRVSRPDLRLPTSDFVGNNSDERRTKVDWLSQTVLGSDARGPVHIWSMQRRDKPISLPAPQFENGVFSIPNDFFISPDQSRAVVVYGRLKTKNGKWPSDWHSASQDVAYDPIYGRGYVMLFDLKTRQSQRVGYATALVGTPPGMQFGNHGLVFSPSSRLFAMAQINGIQIFSSASGKPGALALLPPKMGLFHSAFAFSPDEKMLASLTGTSSSARTSTSWVQIWSVETGKPLQKLYCRNYPTRIRWSPDSQKLAVGDVDGGVTVWDVAPFAPAKNS